MEKRNGWKKRCFYQTAKNVHTYTISLPAIEKLQAFCFVKFIPANTFRLYKLSATNIAFY